ncbi:MAG: acetoacetate--CoA ligase, partial [Gammaproteobacteria bacterium]
TRFTERVRELTGEKLPDYASLHAWSIGHREMFWSELWDFAGVIGEKGERVLVDGDRMPGARWFPDARINFAENLLRRRDDSLAIMFRGEDRVERSSSFNEVYDSVSRIAQALRGAGIERGDRVAGYVPNLPESILAMLATTSIGAIWSSCSPDFGVRGVVDRFGQIEPKVLFTADGYYYNGKEHDSLERVRDVTREVPSIERVVVIPYVKSGEGAEKLRGGATLESFIAPYVAQDIEFARAPFDHPALIMYSSGTTGVPKCIVHGAGGTLVQHLKELSLHTDLKRDTRILYFTTCGWMMWNWLVSSLACEAAVLLYDGSPFHPGPEVLFDYADAADMNVFGTSAKYIDAVKKSGLKPRETHRLESLQTMTSTGSPLVPESFDFVYESIKADLCLSSISGGTDIVSCFALGNPTLPVYRGELQCLGLGLDVQAFDDAGQPVVGEKGELVCVQAFPCMPVSFWNDPDASRYRRAYFEKFENIWCHGDYVAITERGGMIIYGRSDAVLNPGGVRIGTAEIYRQVEQMDEVVEGLVIGQDIEGDVRVVLFVVLRAGLELDEHLRDSIARQIRDNATPRHVPARIVQVTDIPRTRSGKITELAVRDVVHGREVKNKEALANPEALAQFVNRQELGP